MNRHFEEKKEIRYSVLLELPVLITKELLFLMRLSFNSSALRWEGAPPAVSPTPDEGGEGVSCGERHSLSDNKWSVRHWSRGEEGWSGKARCKTWKQQQIQQFYHYEK